MHNPATACWKLSHFLFSDLILSLLLLVKMVVDMGLGFQGKMMNDFGILDFESFKFHGR